jgi:hypothetical protein
MATNAYMNGRRKYGRPQAMLWADNPGRLEGGSYIPDGYEVGQDTSEVDDLTLIDQFIILSDDNRSEIQFSPNRIDQKKRMVNGRMRSYHIADKMQIDVSWDNLPSRSFKESPEFAESGLTTLRNRSTNPVTVPETGARTFYKAEQYTSDGGAGGNELLEWYENHTGPFWVYLAYDKYTNIDSEANRYNSLSKYNEVIQMYITDFKYTVTKRGTSTYDFWNISVTLEEV